MEAAKAAATPAALAETKYEEAAELKRAAAEAAEIAAKIQSEAVVAAEAAVAAERQRCVQ